MWIIKLKLPESLQDAGTTAQVLGSPPPGHLRTVHTFLFSAHATSVESSHMVLAKQAGTSLAEGRGRADAQQCERAPSF